MAIPGSFSGSISALNSQAEYLEALSANVSNLTTAGYKRTDMVFSTVMGDLTGAHPAKQSFVRPTSIVRVDIDGPIEDGGDKDLAIQGPGLFAMAPLIDGEPDMDNITYLRNGRFVEASVDNQSFITNVSRTHVLLAWPTDEDGNFTTVTDPSSLSPVQFDSSAIASPAEATSEMLVSDRLPATALAGETFVNSTNEVIDSEGNKHTVSLEWEKDPTQLRWLLTVSSSSATPSTLATATVDFNSSGNVINPSPAELSFTPSWNNGVAGDEITMDYSGSLHTGTSYVAEGIETNGIEPGNISSTVFDEDGFLNARFTNGLTSSLFKVPVATFINPETLLPQDAGFFDIANNTIAPVMQDVIQLERTSFFSQSVEASNVDLATELSKVMLAQRAYNSASTAFKVSDEMANVAKDLI